MDDADKAQVIQPDQPQYTPFAGYAMPKTNAAILERLHPGFVEEVNADPNVPNSYWERKLKKSTNRLLHRLEEIERAERELKDTVNEIAQILKLYRRDW